MNAWNRTKIVLDLSLLIFRCSVQIRVWLWSSIRLGKKFEVVLKHDIIYKKIVRVLELNSGWIKGWDSRRKYIPLGADSSKGNNRIRWGKKYRRLKFSCCKHGLIKQEMQLWTRCLLRKAVNAGKECTWCGWNLPWKLEAPRFCQS